MITCYAMTLLLVPPLTVLVGRDIVARGRAGASMLSLQRFLAWILRRPRGILLATAALTLLSIGGLVHRGTDWLEHDFSRLRRADSFVSGERYWGRRMDATLRRYLTPTVVMVHDSEQAARVERRLHQVAQEGKAGGLIGSIQSGHRLLEASQRKAILQLRKLRELMTGRLLSALDTETRRLLRTALSDDSLRVLRPEDFPASLVAGFRERNGQLARTVLVCPKLTQRTWEGPRIREFTEDLRAAARSADPRARVAGSLPLSSDIAAAMKHDGPRATALGLMAALVICTMAFGSLRLSIASVASLIVGVVLMMGTLGWSGARLNFLNFVVLPITFGISADYAINILRRYQSERTDRNNEGLAHTAGAVALCSATTIIGFGSLITANNQALHSFGVFAVAGEVTMLATATLSLPAFLALRARRTASALVGRALPGGAR